MDVWIWMQHLLSVEDVADAQISQLSSRDADGFHAVKPLGETSGPVVPSL
jgi:hypothetical protein